jgi:Resolvase, N terminal domain
MRSSTVGLLRRPFSVPFFSVPKLEDWAMKIGHARVSSNSQGYQAQVEALKAAKCHKVYSEKASGRSTDNRHEFKKLMKALVPGDVVVVVYWAPSIWAPFHDAHRLECRPTHLDWRGSRTAGHMLIQLQPGA